MNSETDIERKGFVTEAELDAGLEHILAAPTNSAPILQLCYRPDFDERVFPNSLALNPDKGVDGDRWLEKSWLRLPDGQPDPRNQVSIVGIRLLELTWRNRDKTIHPGDTILTDMNFSEDNLPVGTKLKVGTSVLLVTDKFNDACTKWSIRYGKASRNWIKRPEHIHLRLRGIFCQILEGGTISTNDTIEVH